MGAPTASLLALLVQLAAPPADGEGAPSAPAAALPPAPVAVSPAPSDAPPRWDVPLLHTAGLLGGMRVGLSALWPRSYDPSRFDAEGRALREAYTRPPVFLAGRPLLESDGDPWVLNTVGHGLFGAEVYGRARACGQGPGPSFLLALAASTAWEYGLEALHQRPSALDLAWTPLVGALAGEGRWQLQRALRGGAGVSPGGVRGVLLWVVDPLGEAERRLLGAGC